MIDPTKLLYRAYPRYSPITFIRILYFHSKITWSWIHNYPLISYFYPMVFSILKPNQIYPHSIVNLFQIQAFVPNYLSLLTNHCDVLSFFYGDFGIDRQNEFLLNCSIAKRLFFFSPTWAKEKFFVVFNEL